MTETLYAVLPDEVDDAARALLEKACAKEISLATAESCTGGLLGGALYVATGGYAIVWWFSVALGLASALINLPIVEKPVPRLAPQPG